MENFSFLHLFLLIFFILWQYNIICGYSNFVLEIPISYIILMIISLRARNITQRKRVQFCFEFKLVFFTLIKHFLISILGKSFYCFIWIFFLFCWKSVLFSLTEIDRLYRTPQKKRNIKYYINSLCSNKLFFCFAILSVVFIERKILYKNIQSFLFLFLIYHIWRKLCYTVRGVFSYRQPFSS